MKVFTLTDAYLPAYRYGGIVQTIAAMASQLRREHEFWIVTRSHDVGQTCQLEEIETDRWSVRGDAHVYYMSRSDVSLWTIVRLVREVNADIVYVNAVFSRLTIRYLLARRMGLTRRGPYILAPRGDLSPGALSEKSLRKRMFLELAAAIDWFEGATWQASTSRERDEINQTLNSLYVRAARRIVVSQNICVAQDMVGTRPSGPSTSIPKICGEARFVFISRISPKKNLIAAIEALQTVKGKATLDVYGPRPDEAYWDRCLRAAQRLPFRVTFRYCGELAHADVGRTFRGYDFFLFPTLSENFGHVIIESLFAGCPAVLSDQTPWTDLERRGAGWVIPLSDKARWTGVVQECIDMTNKARRMMGDSAISVGGLYNNQEAVLEQNLAMFRATWSGVDGGEEGEP
jgi:glycosyltransferase involved in cell wall biosynthesis